MGYKRGDPGKIFLFVPEGIRKVTYPPWKDLMGKHAFTSFQRSEFSFTARIFWQNGYKSVDAIKDMDSRERPVGYPYNGSRKGGKEHKERNPDVGIK